MAILNKRQFFVASMSGLFLGLSWQFAVAQNPSPYAQRTLKIVVAKSPGGVDDTVARLLAAYLQ